MYFLWSSSLRSSMFTIIGCKTRSDPQRSRQKCVDTFSGRTHECVGSHGSRISPRRGFQHGRSNRPRGRSNRLGQERRQKT
jgi:hypothetical protein